MDQGSSSEALQQIWQSYKREPTRIKLVDAYMLFLLLTGAVQFFYCVAVGKYPFNAFLAGFISSVGAFVLAGMRSMPLAVPLVNSVFGSSAVFSSVLIFSRRAPFAVAT
jgi:hypothetical protein